MKSIKWLTLLCLAVVVSALVPSAKADSVITFAGFSDGTVLTNQDFGDGVTFAGATILPCCSNLGTGSLNNLFPPVGGVVAGVNVAYNPTGPMTLLFTNPSDYFQAYFTYNSGLTVTAYNSSNAVIGTENGACGASGSGANYVGSGCGTPDELIDITDPGQISKIVITGGTGNNFTIDDVSFSGSINEGMAVPEPSTFAMMLLGLGMIVLARRYKLQHN